MGLEQRENLNQQSKRLDCKSGHKTSLQLCVHPEIWRFSERVKSGDGDSSVSR